MQKEFKVSKVKGARKYKFGIFLGTRIYATFKTEQLAEKSLCDNRSLYEYWSESVSVSVDNSTKTIVTI